MKGYNNSYLKKLVTSKGFAAAILYGEIVLLIPTSNNPIRLTEEYVKRLESVPDAVFVKKPFIGKQVGDRVQVFSPLPCNNGRYEYRYWGSFGKITKRFKDNKLGEMAIVEIDECASRLTVPVNEVNVIERPGLVEVPKGGLTDEQILAMSKGLTAFAGLLSVVSLTLGAA